MQENAIDLNHIFNSLARYEKLALAVSGGVDSTALMHMIAHWTDVLGDQAPEITVLSVDHGLRPDSADEAAFVCSQAEELGFQAHKLTVQGLESGPDLQARARQQRYQLMADFMAEKGIKVLITAHNQDDQAETFLMRLARGSGVDGLSVMSSERDLFGIQINRPLLSLSRAQLRAWLVERDLKWVEDPSNENTDFERVRVRKLLSELDEGSGDFNYHIGQSARRLQRVRGALDKFVQAWLQSELDIQSLGVIGFKRAAFEALHEELQLRVLSRIISVCGGGQRFRYSRLERALTHILGMGHEKFAIGGVIVDGRDEGQFHIYREATHHELEVIDVASGDQVIWDGRILVCLDAIEGMALVGALQATELDLIKTHYRDNLGRRLDIRDEVALGLLVIRQHGQIVSMPQLADDEERLVLDALGVCHEVKVDVKCKFLVDFFV